MSGRKCQSVEACGYSPAVVEMSGEDVEVICGEWEIGNRTLIESGEEYNVILSVDVNI